MGVSWQSLNHTCAKLSIELLEAEEEHALLCAKIIRLRKSLNQAQDRSKQKALCLAQELLDDNDGTEDDSPLNQLIE